MSNIGLVQFLARVANKHGVGGNTYVVGGAMRNHVAGWPIKDFDIVFDSVSQSLGRDSASYSDWFAERIAEEIPARVSLKTNQYGVALLTVASDWDVDGTNMRGEVIEVANARKESYGGEAGKGYKPHLVAPATIGEDLLRRDFTFNTLMWRLGELESGPDGAEVLDLLGCGLNDLRAGLIRTPQDPDVTFSDDPTRMLRAVKFMSRYGFRLDDSVRASISRNAGKLSQMPWDAVRKILTDDVLGGPLPLGSMATMLTLGLSDALRTMMEAEPGFAAAVGRSLSDADPWLSLEVHAHGWPVRTSVSYLEAGDRERLKQALRQVLPDDVSAFNELLRRPKIDQQSLFSKYEIPPPQRGFVVLHARNAILRNPVLAYDEEGLTADVEAQLSQVYPVPGG